MLLQLESINIQRKCLSWGSYTLHPCIYTLTPTFNTNYQIYPFCKIKHNLTFTSSPHIFSGKTMSLKKKKNYQQTVSLLCQTHQLLTVLSIVSCICSLLTSSCVCSLNCLPESLIEVLWIFQGFLD